MDTNNAPLIILCLDAGDPELIQRWVREGYLPTIGSIMDQGSWGITVGPELISEHGIWVSLFSGVSRAKHNYYDFRQLRSGTYDLVGWTSKNADCLPFWSLLRGRQKKTAILDVQDHYPVHGLEGIQLSNWATHEPTFETSADPPSLLKEARRMFGPQMHVEIIWNGSYEQDRRIYRLLKERIRKKGKLYRHLLKRDQYDLVVVSFAESHTGAHQLWKYRADAKKPLPENELTNAIREIYQATDGEMKQILDEQPAGSNVFLVTSAGMEDHFPTSGLLESFCRRLGFQPSPDVLTPSMNPLALARRLLPESVRIAISKHFSREIRERLLADQFRNNTDWQKTTAFALPSFYAGNIRVNLKGREPLGTIDPGRYEDFLQVLKSELLQIIDPETGASAVRWLPTAAELFGSGMHPHLPDLFVKWKPHAHYMQRVNHPKGVLEQNPELLRDSGHSDVGLVAASGPNIHRTGHSADVDLMDLAPTFLSLLGETVPEYMPGKTIHFLK